MKFTLAKFQIPKALCRTLVVAAAFVVCGPTTIAQEKHPKGKVLVVVSSEHTLTLKDGKTHPTGFFLNELGVPLKALVDAGYEPVIADPLGNAPAMDVVSDKPSYFGANQAEFEKVKGFVDSLPAMKHPQPLSKIAEGNLDQYAAIFVPGGHAPMEDLWKQAALGTILKHFHAKGKPTALICHGPIALLSTLPEAPSLVQAVEQKEKTKPKSDWIYSGYQMTVFSDAEETPNEPGRLGGFMKFYPEDALRAAGGKVTVAKPRESHVVQDHELITGQNPFSDNELAKALLKALNSSSK